MTLAYISTDGLRLQTLDGEPLITVRQRPRLKTWHWAVAGKPLGEAPGHYGSPAEALRAAAKTSDWTLVQLYPDTAAGALACLRDDSRLKLAGATAEPDPAVKGVWRVTTAGGLRAIVYLAGYRDPFGDVRVTNDFETEE